MEYIATFHTHYDATRFFRRVRPLADVRMKPVPRALSSSCGTCVVFTAEGAENLPLPGWATDGAERIYRIEASGYDLIFEER